jgi:glutaryl-CoA dehydrogenase
MSRLLCRQFPRQVLLRARPAQGFRSYASTSPISQFNWEDPLGSKNLLTEEEQAISETAERYCQDQLLPRVLRMVRPIQPPLLDCLAG